MASRLQSFAHTATHKVAAQMLGAFTVRDFRWLWGFNALGAMGMTMQMLAQGWLVLEVTDSAFWVGVVSGVQGAGLVGFGAFGGVIADRVNRRNALGLLQLARSVVVLLIAALVITDRIELWHVMGAALFQGVTQGVFLPLNNALIYDTVGRGLLLNAMAARLTAMNLVRLVGSLIVGALITAFGVGVCYAFIGTVIFLSPFMLLLLRAPARRHEPTGEPVWRNLADGLRYVAGAGPLRTLLLLSTLMELFGFSYLVMLPVIARDALEVGATGMGYLSAANSLGSLAATVTVAGLGDVRAKSAMLAVTSTGAGVSLLLFALSPWLALSVILSALVGASLMSYDATMNTTLQLLSSDAMRGRVMGVYGLTFGFTPLGGFLSGSVASIISAPFAVGLGGVAILVYTVVIVLPRMSATNPDPSSSTGEPSTAD